jgi:hypothetical protein
MRSETPRGKESKIWISGFGAINMFLGVTTSRSSAPMETPAGSFLSLLAAQPGAAEELRRLLDELEPQGAAGPVITQHGSASGHARIYQAGRDQHIAQR